MEDDFDTFYDAQLCTYVIEEADWMEKNHPKYIVANPRIEVFCSFFGRI